MVDNKRQEFLATFEGWNKHDQVAVVKELLNKMNTKQRGSIDSHLKILKNRASSWMLPGPSTGDKMDYSCFKELYKHVTPIINTMESNWRKNKCQTDTFPFPANICCFYSDDAKVIAGLSDGSIFIYPTNPSLELVNILAHSQAVLCIACNNVVIISGSADGEIRVWDAKRHTLIQVLVNDKTPILDLKLYSLILINCTQGCRVFFWAWVNFRFVEIALLRGHTAPVTAIQWDSKILISASEDTTIKVWNLTNFDFLKELTGHTQGITCLEYKDGLAISGSNDQTIRLWDIAKGTCLRELEHGAPVQCLSVNSYWIVAGECTGKIRKWRLTSALNPEIHQSEVCRAILEVGPGITCLKFNGLQLTIALATELVTVNFIL